MAPLLEQNFYQPPADYLTPEEPSEPLVDSPLETRQMTVDTTNIMPGQRMFKVWLICMEDMLIDVRRTANTISKSIAFPIGTDGQKECF